MPPESQGAPEVENPGKQHRWQVTDQYLRNRRAGAKRHGGAECGQDRGLGIHDEKTTGRLAVL
jgi:hypothetical protein